ncbi:hypothetical protein [Haloactinomyces albus]|uniref:Uncharacterized protein n=1 Tax=Haloactinomyces albus TaxID=1352928 RepID=A0AAE3ZBR9_9ACTN|nr:hypothetical protein [Haloactinomyces albus]MDR7300935.1 hypothetical protein [Haloactinomyces albus]
MEWLVAWWDGFELWLVQLPYPLLATLMLVVLLPLCWSVAWVIDRGVDEVSAKVTGVRDAEPPPGRRERPDESRTTGGTVAGDHGVR